MSLFPRLLAVIMLALLSVPVASTELRDPYGFAFTTIEGEPLSLSSYRGKALLVANTASLCGFTYQYAGLQRVWERYRDRGLIVLGVPSNDFARQEPGSNAEIKAFCEVNFDIDFPMTEKVPVRGPNAHPLFAWFRSVLGPSGEPRWNFHKYLIGPDGRLVGAWPSTVEPDGPALQARIEALLASAS